MFADDDFVETLHDLGAPNGPDFVPKGSRGYIKVLRSGMYPYMFKPRQEMYMPWLVNADEVVRVDLNQPVG